MSKVEERVSDEMYTLYARQALHCPLNVWSTPHRRIRGWEGMGGLKPIWNMSEVFNPTHILHLNSNHHHQQQPQPTLDF